jgi:hypothetical protein
MRGNGRMVRMRIRRCIWHRNDDCDGEKYIGIYCFFFFSFGFIVVVSGVFVFCCLCDVFVI